MHSVDLSIYQSFIQLSPINHLLDNLLTNPSIYPPTYLSVHLFTHPPILHPPIKLTICPSTHPLSIHLSSCGSMYPSVQLSSHPSTQSSTTHLVYIPICPAIHSSICLSVCHPSHKYGLQSIIHAYVSHGTTNAHKVHTELRFSGHSVKTAK